MNDSSDPTPEETPQYGPYPLQDRRRETDAPAPAETRQFGPYRLLRMVGQGGMATVYEGIDARMDRRVAIKMMTPAPSSFGSSGFAEDPAAMVMRIQREARLLANLSHPNVVMIYDVGQHEGHPYLVMEYVDGVNIQQYLAHRGGPLSLTETADILDQIASGLDALHNAGIVHRDLKSANVMLIETGGAPRVKLLDLGIARPAADLTLTSTGMIMGSPSYVAPEILQGEKATEASDIWSLGVMLYEMLSGGVLPFPGEQLTAVLYRIAHTPAAPLSNLPTSVQTVLNTALSKDPAGRYPSASAFAQAFRTAATGGGLSRLNVNRRTGGLAPALAATAAVLVCGIAGWAWMNRAAESRRPSPPVTNATATPAPSPTVAFVQNNASPVAAPTPAPRPTVSGEDIKPSPTPPPLAQTPVVKPVKTPSPPKPHKKTTVSPEGGTSKPVAKNDSGPLPPYIGPTPEPKRKDPKIPAKTQGSPAAPEELPATVGDEGTAVPDLDSIVASPEPGKRKPPRGPNVDETPPPYLTDASREGVRTALDAWLDASMFGDIDTLMHFYARRMEQYGPAGIDIPRVAVRVDKVRQFGGVRPLSISIDDPRIALTEDRTRALVRFRTTSVWPRRAADRPARTRYEMIWVFTEEGWKIVGERTLR